MSDLAQMIEAYQRGTDAFVQGDPELQKTLFSRRGDVSLANPLGPPAIGWDQVEKTLEHAASQLREGEPVRYERLSSYETPELAYNLTIERSRAKVGGSIEVADIALRVTTIFRQEEDGWKIVHRHADPITSPRPIDSLLETRPAE